MAGTGKKPDTRIVLKPANGEGSTITLASFWTDGERPTGGLDRRIAKMRILLDDGTQVLVVNAKEGRSHWCNLYREQSAPAAPAARPAQQALGEETGHVRAAQSAGGWADDDLPF
jgi:hypothetical protein